MYILQLLSSTTSKQWHASWNAESHLSYLHIQLLSSTASKRWHANWTTESHLSYVRTLQLSSPPQPKKQCHPSWTTKSHLSHMCADLVDKSLKGRGAESLLLGQLLNVLGELHLPLLHELTWMTCSTPNPSNFQKCRLILDNEHLWPALRKRGQGIWAFWVINLIYDSLCDAAGVIGMQEEGGSAYASTNLVFQECQVFYQRIFKSLLS